MPVLASMGLDDLGTWGMLVVATAILNATPGVDLLLVVTRTLKAGSRAGLAAALGIGAGCAVHAAAAASGLAALLAVSANWFSVLKALGVGYLLWTAWGLWRVALSAGPLPAVVIQGVQPTQERSTAVSEFRRGLLTNVLNPKVALFSWPSCRNLLRRRCPTRRLPFWSWGLRLSCRAPCFWHWW